MVDELKEENFLCEWACDSFPLQLLEERVCRSKLAVKQPQTTLHTGSPLIFLLEYEPVERGAVGGGEKTQLLLPFHMSSPSCCRAVIPPLASN